MVLTDLWSYAQLIFTAIGIIAVIHRFLLSNRDNVTELTTFQPPVEDETINIQQIESMYGDISATTSNGPRKKLRCGDYSIGIITALPNEMKAAKSVLDEEHEPPADFRKPDVDYNHYVWGSMSTQSEAAHNVVVASFPARKPGIVTAADVARLMVTTFPSIRLGLMVGIGGGVPTSNDIRLGDVVVSLGSGTTAGVVQYDFGDEEEEGFERKGQLNSPPAALLSAITALKACDSAPSLIRTVIRASSKIQKTDLNLDNEPTYTYQGIENDRLFQSRYHGPGSVRWPIVSSLFRSLQRSRPSHKDCASCDPRMLVKRNPRRLPNIPRIRYGLIASGNKVIKSARTRDKIVASLKQDTNGGDCLCFEMEAAGLMDNFPCLIIRGISDYADTHKNDMWHNYAALTAASYARELLRVLSTAEVSLSKPAREIIGQIQRDVKTIRSDLRKISDDKIHEWLEPSEQQNNFDQAQDEIERYQTESTWFFEHEDYRDWSSHRIHHIWLHGQSGCGKTVLASTVVKQLSAEEKLCLYFFFDFRDTRKQSLESLLRSLIWQLFSRSDSESVKTPVRQLYEDRNSPISTIKKLEGTFDRMIEEVDEVQVILDALDESTRKRTDRDELLRWLKPRTQHEGLGVCKLRTIITSRSDQHDIVNALHSHSPGRREIRIEDESAKVKTNIHQYIHKRLSNDEGFAEWRENPKKSSALEPKSQEQEDMEQWHPIMNEMEKCLVDKAGLMFRWASLTIDSLGDMGTIQKIKGALESLPTGLDEIYTRSLDEIIHHESDAIRILQFLLFADWPLVEKDVLDATSVNVEAPPGRGIDPTRRMNSFDKLSSLMSTFVTRMENTGVIQIAHSSVRDYLIYTGPGNPPKYKFREIPAKASVVAVCLGYIDSILANSTFEDLETPDTFLLQAERIWRTLVDERKHQKQMITKPIAPVVALNHRTRLQEWRVQEEAYNSILKFLIHNGSKLQEYAFHFLGKQYGGPPLYVAATMGLTRIVENLLSAGVRADEKEGMSGFAEAVALPNSFYKNTLDRFGIEEYEGEKYEPHFALGYGNALVAACHWGHHGIVKMLLQKGADVNQQWGRSGTPLHAACRSRSVEIVKLLLDKGAQINAQGGRHETPLSLACSLQHHKDVIRILLANGADVNLGRGDLGPPLQAACSSLNRDQDGTVKMLLEHGADVNAKGGIHGTALHAAVEMGHSRSVKLLLNAGADINIEAGQRGTILEAVCFSKREDTFQLLLEAGANPSSPPPGRIKILQLAAFTERPHIVRYLLETGVDLADLDGFTHWEREFIFRVARESCNEVVHERLEIRPDLEGRFHHKGQGLGKPFPFF